MVEDWLRIPRFPGQCRGTSPSAGSVQKIDGVEMTRPEEMFVYSTCLWLLVKDDWECKLFSKFMKLFPLFWICVCIWDCSRNLNSK